MKTRMLKTSLSHCLEKYIGIGFLLAFFLSFFFLFLKCAFHYFGFWSFLREILTSVRQDVTTC